MRKPVTTSSKIRTTPRARVSSRSAPRNAGFVGTVMERAPAGSRMTAATSCSSRSSRTWARSLGRATSVVASVSGGTPADIGISNGSFTAATRASCTPWKWPWNLTSLLRPVNARATRTARAVVSVPVSVKRTLSAPGTHSRISSAQRTSSSLHAL